MTAMKASLSESDSIPSPAMDLGTGVTFGVVDSSRLFVPESVTQLFYSSIYSWLTPDQKLRYNQLYAAHINEQFSYFERDIGNTVSAALHPVLVRQGNTRLAARVKNMMDDEDRHQSLFDELNRRAFPAIYYAKSHHFIRPSLFARKATAWITASTERLPFLLWLALFFEEFSAHLSRTVLRAARESAQLDPNFVEVHRCHLRDEERHVRLYPELIHTMISGLSSRTRRFQGKLLKWVMREILAPKRSGIAVIRHLVGEFPALKPHENAFAGAVRALKDSPTFFDALFGPDQLPVMHGMFKEFPEFAWYDYRD